MFTSRISIKAQQSIMSMIKRGMSGRAPMIKFTHGNREQIAKDMANTPQPSWFATHTASPSQSLAGGANTQRRVGETVKHGGVTTRVIYMEEGFMGNPFGKGGVDRNRFSEEAMAMIELGGAKP